MFRDRRHAGGATDFFIYKAFGVMLLLRDDPHIKQSGRGALGKIRRAAAFTNIDQKEPDVIFYAKFL